jgi:uncharacterized membrane protein YbhN (UPF0104 family)
MMAQNKRRFSGGTLIRSIGSLVSLGLLIYLISRQGWGEIQESAAKIPVSSLVIVIGLMVISRIAVSFRWYSLLRAVAPSFPFLESLRLTLAGLFAANFLPTTVGGDVVRAAGVLRKTSNRMDAVTSIAADRLIGLTGMAMLVPYGMIESWGWLQLMLESGLSKICDTIVLQTGFLGILQSEIVQSFFDRLKRGASSLAAWLRRPRALLTALGITWVHQVCLFSNVWLFLRGMDDPMSWWLIAGLWSLSYFITLMPFSIGGLGIREISITYIYQEIGGITVESALTLALLLRALDILASIPGAFFLPTILSTLREEEVS